MTRLTIDPVTRLEGHGKIEILLDEAGDVAHTYFQIPELRGFESFCVGRPVEDMPALTNRICGVCPEAHHMAAAKAADAVYKVTPPPAGRKLRELLYNAFYVTDHATHFYVLSGPDLIMGPDAPAAERNILGVVKKVGAEVGKQVIDVRHAGHRVIEIIGGRRIHPCTGVPGGMTKAISEAERQEIETLGQQMVDFAGFSLDLFDKMFAEDGAIEELVTGDLYRHETYYAGLVDANDKVTFYDGRVKVVAPDGEIVRLVRAQGLPRLDRREGGALDLPEVPLPQGGGLEGPRGRQGLGHLHGRAAGTPQRRLRHGHAARAGRLREVLRHALAGRHAGPRDGVPPTGPGSSSSCRARRRCWSWRATRRSPRRTCGPSPRRSPPRAWAPWRRRAAR